MLILISPAKKVNMESSYLGKTSKPLFLNEADILITEMRKKSVTEIKNLMQLSEKLARLNVERYRLWNKEINDSSCPAIFCFKGDVYQGLQADDFSQTDITFAQKHLRIISGLYGLLNPLDAIYAYRLEMGTKLKTEYGESLYQFWKEKITHLLNQQLKSLNSESLINLASLEYFKAVDTSKIQAQVITPIFKDKKNGQFKVISFFAKKARGLMASFIIRNAITSIEDIKLFKESGYQFIASESTDVKWVFHRSSL